MDTIYTYYYYYCGTTYIYIHGEGFSISYIKIVTIIIVIYLRVRCTRRLWPPSCPCVYNNIMRLLCGAFGHFGRKQDSPHSVAIRFVHIPQPVRSLFSLTLLYTPHTPRVKSMCNNMSLINRYRSFALRVCVCSRYDRQLQLV